MLYNVDLQGHLIWSNRMRKIVIWNAKMFFDLIVRQMRSDLEVSECQNIIFDKIYWDGKIMKNKNLEMEEPNKLTIAWWCHYLIKWRHFTSFHFILNYYGSCIQKWYFISLLVCLNFFGFLCLLLLSVAHWY